MKKYLSLAFLCLLLQACGGGDSKPVAGNPQSASCAAEDQRASLMAWMDDLYLWNGQRAPADLAARDMAGFFDSMLYRPLDRYSFAQTTASFDSTFNSGTRVGYGYSISLDPAGDLRVRFVEPLSPVAALGMKRGDRILSIDGFTPQQVLAGALPVVTTEGVLRTFVIIDATGAQRTIEVHSRLFVLTPLAEWKILDGVRDGQPVKVGYLAYHQFVFYNVTLLGFAIDRMAQAGASEMVLDLRYNGGGSVATSRDLASFISGATAEGKVYTRLKFNAQNADQDVDVPFMTAAQRYARPLEGLKRVFVITSGGTASASELLINGLRPYMQVVLVGDTTYGKPYGFIPRNTCGTTYNAVNFEAVNALGAGGFSAGIAADCTVPDDFDHALGDTQEGRLKTALDYISTGRCTAPRVPQSAAIATKKTRPAVLGEGVPEQMFFNK
ncbi:S41 family peptidase [Ramlibacter sp. PS4R-6]|uniref:S41 family peptidase n=1 Tax=Ramlibacter sp. PS4R-6 TaxID=3133438 RepID=UPI0030AB1756